MEEQRRNIFAGLTAFFLTMVVLVAVLCGVRIDCVTGHALHGTVAADRQHVEAVTHIRWLPPSVSALIRVLQAERDAVSEWIYRVSEQI